MAPSARNSAEVHLTLRSGGWRLEAVVSHPPGREPRSGVLLLAPHPRFGGDMENNVIRALANILAHRGHAALRFNYHGVGGSEGPFRDVMESFRYWSEILESDAYQDVLVDARAARDCLLRLTPRIHVVGYSFGAVMALRLAAEHPAPLRVAAVSLAVGRYRLDFLSRISVPVLALHPQADFATPLAVLAERLARVSGPYRIVELAGADHFLRGHEEEAAEAVSTFIAEEGERLTDRIALPDSEQVVP